MEQQQHEPPAQGLRTRTVEMIVAAVIFVLGLVVVYDSQRIGAGWAAEGPQAGYFPFYIGTLICLASLWVLLTAFAAGQKERDAVFITGAQARPVLAVLVPALVFVLAIYAIGLYVASALYLMFFMRWQGKFGFATILPVGLLVPVALFLLFEIWFLVPLPKGPVEALFGF